VADGTITISADAPATDITPGAYEITLVDISEPRAIPRVRAERVSAGAGRSPC
jgi:hypothetical protein